MRKHYLNRILICLTILLLLFTLVKCKKNEKKAKSNDNNNNMDTIVELSLGDYSFELISVPHKKHPWDSGTTGKDYLLGRTEVTYQFCSIVYEWAKNNGYNIPNPGAQGSTEELEDFSKPVTNKNHPVTHVLDSDAVIWCNALTEYYNEINGTNLVPVYKNKNTSGYLRDARAVSKQGMVDPSADGFRLPSLSEWKLAAYFIKDKSNDGNILDKKESYPDDFASGALKTR